jgi:hypothetical protein
MVEGGDRSKLIVEEEVEANITADWMDKDMV